MQVDTYLQDKKTKIESKYCQFTKRIESKYDLIHQKAISKFHRETTQVKLLTTYINKLMKKSLEGNLKSNRNIAFLSQSSSGKLDNPFKENIDWTRGRFSGQIKQIFVLQGQIIEKVFITPKGNIISVKRSELGLLLRR